MFPFNLLDEEDDKQNGDESQFDGENLSLMPEPIVSENRPVDLSLKVVPENNPTASEGEPMASEASGNKKATSEEQLEKKRASSRAWHQKWESKAVLKKQKTGEAGDGEPAPKAKAAAKPKSSPKAKAAPVSVRSLMATREELLQEVIASSSPGPSTANDRDDAPDDDEEYTPTEPEQPDTEEKPPGDEPAPQEGRQLQGHHGLVPSFHASSRETPPVHSAPGQVFPYPFSANELLPLVSSLAGGTPTPSMAPPSSLSPSRRTSQSSMAMPGPFSRQSSTALDRPTESEEKLPAVPEEHAEPEGSTVPGESAPASRSTWEVFEMAKWAWPPAGASPNEVFLAQQTGAGNHREMRWKHMDEETRQEFRAATDDQWSKWVDSNAIEVLNLQDGRAAYQDLERKGELDRILKPRLVMTDENASLRTPTCPLPLKASSRIVIPGYKDLANLQGELRRDAPTGSRLAQRLLFCIAGAHPQWKLRSADVRAAFLKGDPYIKRTQYITGTGGSRGPRFQPCRMPGESVERCFWIGRCAKRMVATPESRAPSREVGTLHAGWRLVVLLAGRQEEPESRIGWHHCWPCGRPVVCRV